MPIPGPAGLGPADHASARLARLARTAGPVPDAARESAGVHDVLRLEIEQPDPTLAIGEGRRERSRRERRPPAACAVSRPLGLAPGEEHVALARLPAFAGVRSGTFGVDGALLPLDVEATSLAGLGALLAAVGALATLCFDPARDRLVVSKAAGGPLELADGTSGLFRAVGIEPGRYLPGSATAPGLEERAGSQRSASREGGAGGAPEGLGLGIDLTG